MERIQSLSGKIERLEQVLMHSFEPNQFTEPTLKEIQIMADQHSNARTSDGRFKKGFSHNLGRKHTPEHIEKNRAARTGVKQSLETIRKRIKWGKEHPNWKGDAVEYGALHVWIKRNFGTPTKCENPNCSFPNPKRYEWANVSGEYSRDRNDWIQLCPSCHRKRDSSTRGVLQFSLNDQLLNVFKSAQEAADSLGIRPQNIHAVCAGRQKSSYGYKWRWLQP